jgi:hypothetical protein
MGHHFTMSGDPLAEYKASRQVSDDDLARRIVQYDGRVSRCDLTTDVWDCSFSPSLLANDLKHKIARIRARTWRLIEGHARGIDGDTLDTGSKSSDKRFRMYDKYAEKRIRDKGSWMRLELQLRRKYARAAVGSCVDNGTEPTITGHIADYLRWDNLEYQQVMIDDSVAPARIPRPDSNRQKWLKGQVAQALASELYVNPDFQADFDIMVSFWLEHLHKSSNGDTLA